MYRHRKKIIKTAAALILILALPTKAFALPDGFTTGTEIEDIGASGEDYDGSVYDGPPLSEDAGYAAREEEQYASSPDGLVTAFLSSCITDAGKVTIVLYDKDNRRFEIVLREEDGFRTEKRIPEGSYNIIGAFPDSKDERTFQVPSSISARSGINTVLRVTAGENADMSSSSGEEQSEPDDSVTKGKRHMTLLFIFFMGTAAAAFAAYIRMTGRKE